MTGSFVKHDDVMKLNFASFVDIYLKLLKDVYDAYKEKLYGKKYKYRLSDSHNTELSFQFTEKSTLHLFGIDVNKIRELFEEYYDLLSIGYDVHDDKKDLFFFIEKLIEKKVCIHELVHEVEGYTERDVNLILNNFHQFKNNRGSNARKYSFVSDLRDCLSDYSFEKMEALLLLSEHIDETDFNEFAVAYPTCSKSEYAMCYVFGDKVISLGIDFREDGTSFLNTIRFNDITSFAGDLCSFSSYGLIVKSSECEKDGRYIQLEKHYADTNYVIECINFFKDNGINFDLTGLCVSLLNQFSNAGVSNMAKYGCAITNLKENIDELKFALHQSNNERNEAVRMLDSTQNQLKLLEPYINQRGMSFNSDETIAFSFINYYLRDNGMDKLCFKDFEEFLQFCNNHSSFNVEFLSDYFNNFSVVKRKYSAINDVEKEFMRHIEMVKYRNSHGKNIKFRYINGNTRMDNIILTKRQFYLANIICNSHSKRLVNSGIQDHSAYYVFRGLNLISPEKYDCLYKVYVEGVKQRNSYSSDLNKVLVTDLYGAVNSLKNKIKIEDELYNIKKKEKIFKAIKCLFDEREQLILELVLDSSNSLGDDIVYSLRQINKTLLGKGILPTTIYEVERLKDKLYKCKDSKVKRKSISE